MGSMERLGPDLASVPNRIWLTTESNGVDDGFCAGFSASTASSGPSLLTVEPLPCPVLLMLLLVFILLGISWRFPEKSMGKFLGSLKSWAVRAMPLVLVITLHWLSSSEVYKHKYDISTYGDYNSNDMCFSFKKEPLTPPLTLAVSITLLFLMAQYQSRMRNSWFL